MEFHLVISLIAVMLEKEEKDAVQHVVGLMDVIVDPLACPKTFVVIYYSVALVAAKDLEAAVAPITTFNLFLLLETNSLSTLFLLHQQ